MNYMNQKISGLHPESQRLLWALVYRQRQSFDSLKPYRQLEQRGLIVSAGTNEQGFEMWEVTPQGEAELPRYAPFLKRMGLNCPPTPTTSRS